MGVKGIDHLYLETRHWDDSVAFWNALGFSFAEQWGQDGHRAGRLVSGDAVLVLAEAGDEMTVFFSVADTAALADVAGEVEHTHWGTKMIRVTDPDGKAFALEESE